MSGNQRNLDNHANQLNKNNDEFFNSRGAGQRPSDWGSGSYGAKNPSSGRDLDNHANQRNPNNREYSHSRQAGAKK